MSKRNTISFDLDPNNPPKASKADLKRLDKMKDGDIDYSDIPELGDEFWRNARMLRPSKKKMISLRIDEEVANWFRKQGKGYQSYMNAVLRAFTEANGGVPGPGKP